MKLITLLSPAKVNLFLEIIGVREDGHHLLRSIMQPVDLFDEVSIEAVEGNGFELSIDGSKDIPKDYNNLVIKAAQAYLNYTGIKAKIRLGLKKRIPTHAGLGGGSSNAAATLYGLNRIYNKLDNNELMQMGTQISADVPFFISCRTSFVEGVGDKIKIINSFPLLNYIIVKPPFGLDTKLVYEKWDNLDIKDKMKSKNIDIDNYIKDFRKSNYLLSNDLEKPAIQLNNKVQDVKNLLINLGCTNVSMTGSGSAVFAIFNNIRDAEDVFYYLKNSYDYKVFLCKGISGWHRI